jgi:glycosyltransferase involved in cell wall biosynthesis
MSPCVSIIVPVYNEQNTIEEIINKVSAQPCVQEIIIVDDCSRDQTSNKLKAIQATNPLVQVYSHSSNQGKGASIRTGIPKAKAPYVLIQDADLEYDPAEYITLLAPLLSGKADVVFGSRFGSSGVKRVLYFWHSVGNQFLTLLSNMFTNLNLTDMETCYKMFRREIIQAINIQETRFGFEPEIVAKLSQIPEIRIYEVPISYYGRTYQEGKKIGWRDGFRAIWCILKYNVPK